MTGQIHAPNGKLKAQARDYLVEILSHHDFPEALRIPHNTLKVLLNGPFEPGDPLSDRWQVWV